MNFLVNKKKLSIQSLDFQNKIIIHSGIKNYNVFLYDDALKLIKSKIEKNDIVIIDKFIYEYYFSDLKNQKKVFVIKSSEKIKWIYLKPNTMNIKQIGFKGYDDPPKIMEFIEQNIDYDKLFTRALEKKIRMFYEALKWDMPVDKANTLERFF